MALRTINANLIAVIILLMTNVGIVLRLLTHGVIANLLGGHALHCAGFSSFGCGCNVFISISGARADPKYRNTTQKKMLKIHIVKSLLELLTFYMFKALITLFLCVSLPATAIEKPEGNVYCHGKAVVEYRLVNPEKDGTASDVDLTVNGKTARFMTAYSWFGSNQVVPKGFKFAILGEKHFDPLLVYDSYLEDARKQKYTKCN